MRKDAGDNELPVQHHYMDLHVAQGAFEVSCKIKRRSRSRGSQDTTVFTQCTYDKDFSSSKRGKSCFSATLCQRNHIYNEETSKRLKREKKEACSHLIVRIELKN